MDSYPLSAALNYPLSVNFQLSGRIGDYWLENGIVKYKTSELRDCSPSTSRYTNYEWIETVKVLSDPPETLLRRLMAKKHRTDANSR